MLLSFFLGVGEWVNICFIPFTAVIFVLIESLGRERNMS